MTFPASFTRRLGRARTLALRAGALSWRDRMRAVEIAAAILYVSAGLQFAPKRMLRAISRPQPVSAGAPVDESLITLFDQVGRSIPLNVNCLPRSLALQILLRRRGVETAVVIGVRRQAAVLEAHAWLEDGRRVIGDSPEVEQIFKRVQASPETVEIWIDPKRSRSARF